MVHIELAQFPVTGRGRLGVRKADLQALQRLSLDFLLLLQRVVVSSEQELGTQNMLNFGLPYSSAVIEYHNKIQIFNN